MTPAIYNPPFSVKRGDTLQGWEIAKLTHDNGDPVGITSARMQLRTQSRQLIYQWATGVSGNMLLTGATETKNVLTLEEVAAETTATWPVGPLFYDLEVTFDTGEVATVLEGSFGVSPDITR